MTTPERGATFDGAPSSVRSTDVPEPGRIPRHLRCATCSRAPRAPGSLDCEECAKRHAESEVSP